MRTFRSTAHIDGLCASAATIVACHADKVVAAADGSYMVHPVSMGVCDYLTAEDLNNCLKALETIRSSIVTLYAKKSGKTEDECAKWMDETNWWTATEAKEKGFVDEVDDEADDSIPPGCPTANGPLSWRGCSARRTGRWPAAD